VRQQTEGLAVVGNENAQPGKAADALERLGGCRCSPDRAFQLLARASGPPFP
jgi:hypothetical protein